MIVACLPTLRPLFRGASPESVIQSIRSKLSLQSLRSRSDVAPTKTNDPRTSDDTTVAITSKGIFTSQKNDDLMETFIMSDQKRSRSHIGLNPKAIKVCDDVTQSVEQV